RRHLRDRSGQRAQCRSDLCLTRRASSADHGTGLVVGVSLLAEFDDGLVYLRLGVDESGKSRCPAQQQNQQPGRERIEGAEVTDASLAVNATHVLDDIMRGHASRLVYEEQSLDWRRGVVASLSRLPAHGTRQHP